MLRRLWQEWGRDLIVALALGVVIHVGVAEARLVPTPSMVPTIVPGDRVMTEKFWFRLTALHRGDIVVFDPPFDSKDAYLKRVIGLPGETVEIRNGEVRINGTPLIEPYINDAPTYTMEPVVVPKGKLLVLGDNRNNSYDSHSWGLLDMSAVKGRAIFRFWPLSRFGMLK